MRVAILASALALLAGQAMAADQFDLVCKGLTSTIRDPGNLTVRQAELEFTLHIDLHSGEYCPDKCDRVMQILRTDHDYLVLNAKERVSRRDGNYSGTSDITVAGPYVLADISEARCDARSFTPFPAAKF